jgi:glycerol-3-phosphate dehydrogenase subunit C
MDRGGPAVHRRTAAFNLDTLPATSGAARGFPMSTDKPISYQPTEGLCYDPEDPKYWQPEMLAKEVERVFEVCNGCRMCFKYCDSFPMLFKLLEDKYEGDVRRLGPSDVDRIMDACFQCKLCEVQCPYTPRDGHEYQLDFPKLVHRYRAHKARREGIPLRDRILGRPDAAGRMARLSFGMANVMNRVRPHRIAMELTLGVHRDKLLPDFAHQTFESWAEKQGLIVARPAGEGDPEAILFPTCFVQNNEPHIGQDAIDVLRHNQVKVGCVQGLQCCGMPAWEHGDLAALHRQAARNIEILGPFVDKGAKILSLNPTCAMMMRREYVELLPASLREAAARLAAAVMDPSEYLWSIREQERFNTSFKSTPGEALAYHAPCHLRAQAVGFRSRDLMRRIPGVKPKLVMECCGHNGTYAMKVEGFDVSRRLGAKAFDGMKQAEAEVWSTDCPLAALQFQQHAGRKPLHPMTVLARAYREDGFPTKLPQEAGGKEDNA